VVDKDAARAWDFTPLMSKVMIGGAPVIRLLCWCYPHLKFLFVCLLSDYCVSR